MDKLSDCVTSLFANNDSELLLRLFPLFTRKCTELFHGAIINNYFVLMSSFMSITPNNLLQQKKELDETILLHIACLNRIDILKALLEKEFINKLFKDNNHEGQKMSFIILH